MTRFFSGLNDATATGSRTPKLDVEGDYEVKILDFEVQQIRQPKGPALFVEFEVVKTADEKRHPIGAKRKWKQSLVQDSAMGNLKAFLYALLGRSPRNPADADALKKIDSMAEDLMETAVQKKTLAGKPLTDLRVAVNVVREVTEEKEGKQGFTWYRHNWGPASKS